MRRLACIRLTEEAEEAEEVTGEVVDEKDAANKDKDDAEEEEEEEEEDLLSTPAFLKQKLKVLEKELAEMKTATEEAKMAAAEAAEEWAEKRTRLQGDFDNFRARHANQTLEAQVDARIKLLQDFLPVLDNFDRARSSISPSGEAQEATNARYSEMHAALMNTLENTLNMEKIPTVGAEFDYNLHNAIQQVPSDEYDEGIVCSELQPGYTCKGSLVRPAYVMVSSG
jgi:molecular chaperone GrpE